MGDFVIGERVAIYTRRAGSEGAVELSPIERETKLYWIVKGRKFRKSDGSETGDWGLWNSAPELRRLDDQQVIRAQREAHVSNAYTRVVTAQNALAKGREDRGRIAALRAELDHYQQALEASPPF
jgi:hypothetical protein